MPASTAIIGIQGEELAEQFIRSLGYDILGRNVRMGRDEIDIVARDFTDDVVVFVEVKTRSAHSPYFRPETNMDLRKRLAMDRAAKRWVAQHDYDGGYRLDLICVTHGRITDHWKQLTIDSD